MRLALIIISIILPHMLGAVAVVAQNSPDRRVIMDPPSSPPGKRVALVIGNGAYARVPHLPNPPHDAEDVSAALKRTGFDTILGIDLEKARMEDAAINFAKAARNADV